MKIKGKLALLLLLVISSGVILGGCIGDKTTDSGSDSEVMEEVAEVEMREGYTEYSNEEVKLAIMYPEDWTIKEDFFGSVAFFLSPLSEEGDVFQENVGLLIEDLQGQKISLDDYTDLSIKNIELLITDAKIIGEPIKTTLMGEDAYELRYTGKQGQLELEWHQIWTIKDGQAYIISLTTGFGQTAEYDDVFVYMASSLKMN